MDNVFHTQLDLDVLADAIAPLIAERLGLEYGSKPASGRTRRPAANEPDDWPNEPNTVDDEADPWSDDPPAETARPARSQQRSAPSRGSSGSSRQSGGSNQRPARPARGGGNSAPCASVRNSWPSNDTKEDNFGRVWYFGEPDAPECHGGHVAAMVDGTSQSGNAYRVWACPVGFTRDYKKKCDFWEYIKD